MVYKYKKSVSLFKSISRKYIQLTSKFKKVRRNLRRKIKKKNLVGKIAMVMVSGMKKEKM